MMSFWLIEISNFRYGLSKSARYSYIDESAFLSFFCHSYNWKSQKRQNSRYSSCEVVVNISQLSTNSQLELKCELTNYNISHTKSSNNILA